MSDEERLHVIYVAKNLHENGVIKEITDIHAKCWTPYHKSFEGIIGHQWIAQKIEQAMREIDKNITLPYWVKFVFLFGIITLLFNLDSQSVNQDKYKV